MASTLNIGTGSGTTASAGYDEFVIQGGDADIGMAFLSPAANDRTQTIAFGDSNNNKSGFLAYNHSTDVLTLDAAVSLSLDAATVVNESSNDVDFRVESDTQSHAFYVNGGNNSVGINTSAPDGALTVVGTATSGDLLARFQHGVNDNDVKAIRVNAPNASGTHGYVDLGVDPEVTQGGLAVSTSSGGLIAGQANLTDYAAIIWDANRHVTMPGQPAFRSDVTTEASNKTGGGSNYAIIEAIWTDRYDRNSDFSNGTFTAPVTGIYHFDFCLTLAGTTTSMLNSTFSFIASNRTLTIYKSPGADRNNSLGGTTYILSMDVDMDANDTCHLQINVDGDSDTVDVFTTSSFSGHLIG